MGQWEEEGEEGGVVLQRIELPESTFYFSSKEFCSVQVNQELAMAATVTHSGPNPLAWLSSQLVPGPCHHLSVCLNRKVESPTNKYLNVCGYSPTNL